MSQGFKLRFDQMREGDPTAAVGGEAESFPTPSHARNLCLEWADGRRFFLSYAYLVAGEFRPDGETNRIRLEFTSHTVSLRGYRLEALFTALLDHLPKVIGANDARYASLEESGEATVIDILLEKNGT